MFLYIYIYIYIYATYEVIICLFQTGKIDNPDHLNQQDMSKLAFGEADFNHDNKITKDEFIKACLGSDKIVAVLAFKMIDVVSAESSC